MKKTTEEPELSVASCLPLVATTSLKYRSLIDQLNTSVDSEDEFVSIPRGRRKKRATIVSDDESSRDSFVGSPVPARPELRTGTEETEDSQSSQESVSLEVKLVIHQVVLEIE